MNFIGTKLYGYCNGYFGRDSYEDKTIIAMGCNSGTIWIVCEDEDGDILFASFESKERFDTFIEENTQKDKSVEW